MDESKDYPTIPTIARGLWLSYGSAVLGTLVGITLFGALGALGVLAFLEGGGLYYQLAVMSLTAISSAFYIRDVWTGEHDPESDGIESLPLPIAGLVFVGIALYFSTVLFGTTYIAVAIAPSQLVALSLALIVPVADLAMNRATGYSPAGMVLLAYGILLQIIGVMTRASLDTIPVLGTGRNPPRGV